jgi:MarR family transcriptional regulator, lower aerobic nicotinate degradation pathway regulator
LGLPRDILSCVAEGEYDPPERVRRLPSWLLGQAHKRSQELVGDALARDGARRPHFVVLASLADQGPASQATLGRRVSIDRSDLHAIVAELERDGLIGRTRDPEDRRRNVVTLTAAGKATLGRLNARISQAQRDLLAPLSPSDRRELVRLLSQLVRTEQ